MITIKKSSVTYLSDKNDLRSHRGRIVLEEKEVSKDIEYIDLENPPEDFIDINPYHTLPVLVDRDLVLNEPWIIIEYLDERFPHPPLLPVSPVAKAKTRMMVYRIEQDWYSLYDKIIENRGDVESINALKDQLSAIDEAFADKEYFLSADFSVVDCTLMPLLWRLPEIGIVFPEGSSIKTYEKRMFERESFITSLNDEEKAMRKVMFDEI